MIALSYLILSQANPADPVLKRFETFMHRPGLLSVHISATSNQVAGTGTGTLFLSPNKIRFDMKWGNADYTLAMNGDRGIEIAQEQSAYDEFETDDRVATFGPNLGAMIMYGYPQPFMFRSLKALAPPESPFKLIHKATAKDPTDTVQAKIGPLFVLTAKVDATGRLLTFSSKNLNPEQNLTREYVLDNYVLNPQTPANWFSPEAPTGFTPFSLPWRSYPPNAGDVLPLGSWSALDGTKKDLAAIGKSKPLLLFLVDPEFEASASALKDLPAIRAFAKAKGAGLAVLVQAKTAAVAKTLGVPDALFDPTYKQWNGLRTPGTPSYLLLEPGGKTSRLWLGYDPDEQKDFLADLKSALEEITKN